MTDALRRRARELRAMPEWVAAAVLAGLAVANVLFVVTHIGLHLSNSDVRLYYAAAQVGEHHGWQALYDPRLQQQAVAAATPHSFYVPFVNPPWLAWLTALVGWLPYPAVYFAAMAAGFGALCGAALLVPSGSKPARLAYMSSALALQPAVIAGYYANAVVVFPLVLVGAWRLLRAHRDALAGLLLAITSVKPHLVVLVPLALLLGGRYRATLTFLAALLVLATAAVLTLSGSGVRQYLALLGQTAQRPHQQVATLSHTVGGGALAWAVLGVVAALVLAVALAHRHCSLDIVLAAAILGSMLMNRYLNGLDWTAPLAAVWLLTRSPLRARAVVVGALWLGLDAVVSFPALAPSISLVALLCVPLLA